MRGGRPLRKNPVVMWIAITLGVTMIGIGLLLFLWGLSWQSAPESDPLSNTELSGGPGLIPLGVLMIAFGGMWIWMGWYGFPRRGEIPEMQRCPHCNRGVEEDLDFCYYCGERFPRSGERKPPPQGSPDRTKRAPGIEKLKRG